MLKIKNNRFIYGGVSLPLPNGLYLDIFEPCRRKSGIEFKSENKDFDITIDFFNYNIDIEEKLKDSVENCEPDAAPATPVRFEINGLRGIYSVFDREAISILEAHFESADKSDIHFSFSITVDKNRASLKEVLRRIELKTFLRKIRLEDRTDFHNKYTIGNILKRGIETLILYSHFKNYKDAANMLDVSYGRARHLIWSALSRLYNCGCGRLAPEEIFERIAVSKTNNPASAETVKLEFARLISNGLAHGDEVIRKCWQEAFNYYDPTPEGLLTFLGERFDLINRSPGEATNLHSFNDTHYIPNEIVVDWKSRQRSNVEIRD